MAKRHLKNIELYRAGKPIEELEREMGLKDVIKMASNENPLGPSPEAISALRKNLETVHYYPDSDCFHLKKALKKKWDIDTDCFIIGNGSDEIIMLIAAAFLEKGNNAVIGWPSFVIYPLVIKKFGAEVIPIKLKDFRFDLPAMARRRNKNTKVIFIANPNNPTGTMVSQDEVTKFLDGVPQSILIVFDEAYAEFVDDSSYPRTIDLVKERPNVLMLRTFSKCYGLAGLRVGYGIGSKKIVSYLNKMREPFNVNRLAQTAATAALSDTGFLTATKDTVKAGRDYLYQALEKRGINYIPTVANFILVELPETGETISNKLLKEGVIVRTLKEYDLRNYIRVSFGLPDENRRFIQAMDRALAG